MANRYTQYRPTEFVQTYDPYPFEEMFKMGQYKQGRADQASLVAGKLAGEANIEGGYFTGDAAQQINKERAADINEITALAGTGNLQGVYRKYGELQNKWKNNPMLESIKSDAEQKKFVDAYMARDGYGNERMLTSHDPTTGQFIPNEAVSAKIARGEKITFQDYGGIENVADIKAYTPYITPIKAAIDDEYDVVTNETTGKPEYRHKKTNEVLDYDGVLNHSVFLNSFKNDDGTINMEALKATDPELYKNAIWKQESLAREGRAGEFKWDNLVDDYMDIASLHFYTRGKQNITGIGGSKGTKKPIGTEEMGMFGDVPIAYNAINATNGAGTMIKTLDDVGRELGIDPHTGMDIAIGMSVNDLIYTPPSINDADIPASFDKAEYKKAEREKYDKEFTEKQLKYTDAIYNIELDKLKKANPDAMVRGVKVSTMDPLEMERTARNIAESNMNKRKQYAHALYETELKFSQTPDKIPPSTPENLEEELESSPIYNTKTNKELIGMTSELFNKIVGLSKKDREALFEKYPTIGKSVAHPYYDKTENWNWNDDSPLRSGEEVARGVTKVNETFILQNKKALLEEFKNFDFTPRSAQSAKDTGILNKDVPKKTYYEEYIGKAEKVKTQVRDENYKEYYTELNNNIEKAFQNPEITTTGKLLYSKEGGFSEAEIPFYHKIVTKAAVERMAGGVGVYYKGKPLTAFNTKDSESTQGHVKADLFLAGGDGTDEAATGNFSNGTFIPTKFYFNNANDKWMARGSFSAEDSDGNPIKSSEYDVDISENMDEFLSYEAQNEIFTTDRAIDILSNTYKGTATIAKFGGPKEETELFGEMKVYGNPDGTFAISGKMPVSGTPTEIQSILRDRGVDPLSLSKDKAAEYLGDAFKYRVQAAKEFSFSITAIPEEYQYMKADVATVLSGIAKNEAIGGSYDSMNQGSYDSEGKKPKGSGLSNKIINKSLSEMTIGEIMDHQSRTDNSKIHAAGKYQFIPSTLNELVGRLGLSKNIKFNETTQDRLALEYAVQTAKEASDKAQLNSLLQQRWLGIENLSDEEKAALVNSAWKLAGKS